MSRSCNQDFAHRVREFLENVEQVHLKAPPPVSQNVIAGPKAFIDQCELLSTCVHGAVLWLSFSVCVRVGWGGPGGRGAEGSLYVCCHGIRAGFGSRMLSVVPACVYVL